MTTPGTVPSKLRVGILGAGMITTVSYGFLPGLKTLTDRVEVVAIASRTRELSEKVALDWGIPEVYDNLTQMLARADIDAVINATPIPSHYETNLEILSAGKHLVTDKTLALTVADAERLCDLADARGLLVVVAPHEMLTGDWAEARRLVRAGALGKVAFARVQSSHAGPAAMNWPVDPTPYYGSDQGSLFEMGVYGIDRVTSILGPARRVSAFSALVAPERVARGGFLDGRNFHASADDNVLLMLDFGGGTFAFVDGCFTVAATRSAPMEIYGIDGTLVVQRPGSSVEEGQFALELFRFDVAAGLSGWTSPMAPGIPRDDHAARAQRAALVGHLADCLQLGTKPVTGGRRATHVLEVMLAAKTSASEGRIVELETTFDDPWN